MNFFSAFNPSRIVPPPGSSRSSGHLLSAGDQLNRPSQSVTDRSVLFFLHVFLLGFLVEETPCEHGENMQTPHRKAREIAHLSTEGLGRTCPPEPTAPHVGIEPMTLTYEVAVQAPEPPCHITLTLSVSLCLHRVI